MAVPENWRMVLLGDVLLKIIGGGTPSKQIKSYWNGSIPWLTVKDMRSRRPTDSIDHISEAAVKESSTNIIPANTVIIATRIGLGKVVRVAYDAAINQDLKALITPPNIDNGYLEYWIVSIAGYLESIGSGTTVKGIRLEQVRSLPFPLAPLDQQKRIVAEIEKQFSRLDEAVANLKRVKANLKRYKAAVLKAAVEGKLTEEWRKQHPDVEPADKLLERILTERREKWQGRRKYKEPVAPDTSDLPELPEGWVWSNLEQLSEAIPNAVKAGPFGSALKKSFYVPEGYKVYGQEQVIREDPYYGNYFIDEDRFESLKSCAIKPGDMLISLVGTIGRVLILPKNCAPGIINPRLVKISINKDIVNPLYIKAFLQSPFVKYLFSLASHGGTMDILNLGILKGIPIPIPPTPEQKIILNEFASFSSVEENLENTVGVNQEKSSRLRQSILKKAFLVI